MESGMSLCKKIVENDMFALAGLDADAVTSIYYRNARLVEEEPVAPLLNFRFRGSNPNSCALEYVGNHR